MKEILKNKTEKKSKVTAEVVLKKLEAMKKERKEWEPMWNKAAEMCAINSNLFSKDEKGRHKQNVFDSTARNALTCFAASMKSVIVPTTSRWHRLKAVDPKLDDNEDVKKYDVGKILPVVIFVDGNGNELERLVGEQKESLLIEIIDKYRGM